MVSLCAMSTVFFFNDTATTEIYTLSLHDALPIFTEVKEQFPEIANEDMRRYWRRVVRMAALCHDLGHLPFSHAAEKQRSEEHTSELQSRPHLVCRLLLAKKNYPASKTIFRSHWRN